MKFIIDLDNTLVVNPFSRSVFPYLARIFEEVGPKYDYIAMFKQEAVNLRRNKRLFESYDWDLIIKNVSLTTNVNVQVNVKEVVKMFCKKPYISLVPGAIDLLEFIKENNHEAIILSNGYLKYQRPVIQALNLSKFNHLVTSDMVGYIKPQIEFFKYAANLINQSTKQNVIVVGDSLLYDIWGGAAAGFSTVWFHRDSMYNDKHLKLKSFNQDIVQMAEDEGLKWYINEIPDVEISCIQKLTELKGLIMN